MTGRREERVTYPQFYALPGGDLLFVYRDGQSGRGDVLLDRYDVRARAWRVLQHPLIAGEGARNAYVNQLAIDARGGWHLSWVWRESPDVATNHDVLYAHSPDEGRSWRRSSGDAYTLPITASTAEVAWSVPQGSELINQTSAATDSRGRPVIATYWRDTGSQVPQLRLVWHDGCDGLKPCGPAVIRLPAERRRHQADSAIAPAGAPHANGRGAGRLPGRGARRRHQCGTRRGTFA